MAMGQLPLFTALSDKMRWHQVRQSVLAQNVANSDTPGYRGRELKPFDLEEQLRNASSAKMATATTNGNHLAITRAAGGTQGEGPGFKTTPQATITLEDEMMKVTANQMDYRTVTTLYQRSMKILRTALGR